MNSKSKIPKKTIEVYKSTRYRVRALPSPFVLRIGEASAQLGSLMKLEGVSSCAFLTACNPHGKQKTVEENVAAQKVLELEVRRTGLSYLPGVGEDPTSPWKEESFLVLGLGLVDAKNLGKKFKQNAFVFALDDGVPQLKLLK